jgi:hypothetical protein
MKITPRTFGKAAAAAGSAALVLGVYGGTSFASAQKPSDGLLPCATVGGALPPVGAVCDTVNNVLDGLPVPLPALPTADLPALPLPSLPSLPIPNLPIPDLGLPLPTGGSSASAAPTDGVLSNLPVSLPSLDNLPVSVPGLSNLPSLPVVGDVLDSITGAGGTGGLPSLPGIGGLDSIVPSLTDLPGLPSLPVVGGGTGGVPGVGSLPIPNLPSTAVVPTVVAKVFDTVQPIVDGLQSALPTGALPTGALPLGDLGSQLTTAAAPIVAPVLGALAQVNSTVDSILPQAAPALDPLVGTVVALPGQVAALLQGVLSTTPATPSTPVVGNPVGNQVASPKLAVTAEVSPPNVALNHAAPNSGASNNAAAPAAVAAPTASGSVDGGGSSLPVTGIGLAGVGLAGAIALSWGVMARTIAARRRLAGE